MTPSSFDTAFRSLHRLRPAAHHPPLVPQNRKITFCVKGALSPLLSNLLLDEWYQELERRGHRFMRYADDSNIYVPSERAGKRVITNHPSPGPRCRHCYCQRRRSSSDLGITHSLPKRRLIVFRFDFIINGMRFRKPRASTHPACASLYGAWKPLSTNRSPRCSARASQRQDGA